MKFFVGATTKQTDTAFRERISDILAIEHAIEAETLLRVINKGAGLYEGGKKIPFSSRGWSTFRPTYVRHHARDRPGCQCLAAVFSSLPANVKDRILHYSKNALDSATIRDTGLPSVFSIPYFSILSCVAIPHAALLTYKLQILR
jgi:hypothetical protein